MKQEEINDEFTLREDGKILDCKVNHVENYYYDGARELKGVIRYLSHFDEIWSDAEIYVEDDGKIVLQGFRDPNREESKRLKQAIKSKKGKEERIERQRVLAAEQIMQEELRVLRELKEKYKGYEKDGYQIM